MKKLIITLTGLLILFQMIECSDNNSKTIIQTDNTDADAAISSSVSGNNQPGSITDFNPEDYDVILCDDDDWYFLLNYSSKRASRTYIYKGIVYAKRESSEYYKDAFIVYDDKTQSLAVGCESPFNATDFLVYTTIYDPSVGDGYEFTGSYGWRDHGYGYILRLDFIKGRLGSLTPPMAKSTGAIVFKEAKPKEYINESE